jgi:hypothetical protein
MRERAMVKKSAMMGTTVGLLALLSLGASGAGERLHPKLEPLRPFVGKTLRGEFANSTPEKPLFDVQRWERALNGKAIRILHSVNAGEYGGETLLFWDEKQKSVVFYYFTTEGFDTHGTMTVEADGGYTAHEIVTGNGDGITEVRSRTRDLGDGRVEGSSSYLKNGEWVPGHSVIYVEAPDAEVVFR